MLDASRRRILDSLGEDDLVLDVGGWARPFPRADWVLDLMPYETRGLYGAEDTAPERFSEATWVRRDLCNREPWPWPDGHFAYAVCSHTLEDVRDPVWACSELARVARAGYVEVPSRLEEQSFGPQGPWVGWGHHHWLIERDETGAGLVFVFKPHILHGAAEYQLPAAAHATLTPQERALTLWWEGGLPARERIFIGPGELEAWLAAGVAARRAAAPAPGRRRTRGLLRRR